VQETSEKDLANGKNKIIGTLETNTPAGKKDLNNASLLDIKTYLMDKDPMHLGSDADQKYTQQAQAIVDTRDKVQGGVLSSFDQLTGVQGVTPQILAAVKQQCALGPFTILSAEVVGPKIGAELQRKAILAVLYALGGMLVYIAFRFEWIYGAAAVIAVFHDTLITIGLFSLFNKEITLTVVAALLTLVGYSMNDTIVTFDRIRENLKILRREELETLINKSVNQTLSRTVLTSGLTLLTALALFIFGGQVLNGFAFALVCGIIVGTYSSVFVASPILIFWHNFLEGRKRGGPGGPAIPRKEPSVTASAKAKTPVSAPTAGTASGKERPRRGAAKVK